MFRGVFPLIAGLTLAGGLSQFPEFAQQYTQRVAGAYFEIRDVADGFRADAAASGKSTGQAIADLQSNDDQFLRDRGGSMEMVLEREAFLAGHYQALTSGNGYDQLVVFASERDNEIALDALGIYKPAMPVTFTGGAHAALGFLIGFVLLRLPFRLRRRKTRTA